MLIICNEEAFGKKDRIVLKKRVDIPNKRDPLKPICLLHFSCE